MVRGGQVRDMQMSVRQRETNEIRTILVCVAQISVIAYLSRVAEFWAIVGHLDLSKCVVDVW